MTGGYATDDGQRDNALAGVFLLSNFHSAGFGAVAPQKTLALQPKQVTMHCRGGFETDGITNFPNRGRIPLGIDLALDKFQNLLLIVRIRTARHK